jgi:D-xylose transport system permease protein
LQGAGLTALAIGIVFVLLIAEIDLSVAYVSAVGGVTMTLLLREGETAWPWYAAIAAALLFTALIGFIHGLIITKTGVPSFVVTLAGLLAWSGVVLIMTTRWSTAGTIVIQNTVVLAIANSFLSPARGWLLFAVVMLAYLGGQLAQRRSLRQQSLNVKPMSVLVLQAVALAIITGGAVWFANTDRGVPTAAVIVLVSTLAAPTSHRRSCWCRRSPWITSAATGRSTAR